MFPFGTSVELMRAHNLWRFDAVCTETVGAKMVLVREMRFLAIWGALTPPLIIFKTPNQLFSSYLFETRPSVPNMLGFSTYFGGLIPVIREHPRRI